MLKNSPDRVRLPVPRSACHCPAAGAYIGGLRGVGACILVLTGPHRALSQTVPIQQGGKKVPPEH